jgi:hypothetical protein
MKRLLLLTFFSVILFKGKAQLNFTPNPFSASAIVTYTLPSSVAPTYTVNLYVYELTGQHVQTLINDSIINAGTYSFNYTALGLPTGQYIFSLMTGDTAYNKKVIYMGGGMALGINEFTTGKAPLIYPNPASSSLNIDYTGLKRVDIIDLNGKKIKSLTTNDKTISITDVSTGYYLINVYSEQNKLITTQKLYKAE